MERVHDSMEGSRSGTGRRAIILRARPTDRKSTRLNSSHSQISYAVFCLKKKNNAWSMKIVSFGESMPRSEPSVVVFLGGVDILEGVASAARYSVTIERRLLPKTVLSLFP